MGWPSCERLALTGIPPSRLPASLTGLTARFTRLGLIDREGSARDLLALELGNQRGEEIFCPLPEFETLVGIQDQPLNKCLRLLTTRFPNGFDG